MTASTQVLGISNAIVDVLAHVDEEFLTKIDAPKGSMILVDADRAQQVYGMMGPATEMSGGSVANTIAGFANIGGRAAYIGRVADDQLGRIFVHDMQSLGVDVRLEAAKDGAPTARCYILITPDGQRTMQTYLGACLELNESDVTEQTAGKPEMILLEGYVCDTPQGQVALNAAFRIADGGDTGIALSLSDAECVARHRLAFLDAITNQVSLVIGDDSEVMRLFEAGTVQEAANRAAEYDCVFAMTCSAEGSVIVNGAETVIQEAYPVDEVIDTTGAGDAFAAAFLFGWVSGKSLQESADLGSVAGAAVIQQVGARLQKDFLENARLPRT